ncbi:MAG: hypothetical protein IT238_08260 [Bacteroidia bacterium]|nr:hypothetical protein [Bacteroidia bacterium]MCZ2248583.1 hypothetical protein [Bacteroidia bacterium]
MKKEIKYIQHSEINRQSWDYCIDQAINSIVYAYSWYLDVVSPNWDALVLGNYEAVMPLTQKKKITFQYLCQPFFTQQLGVFYSNLEFMNITNSFLEAIPEKYKLVEINLNTFIIASHPDYTITSNITCHLNLNKPYQELRNNFSTQILRNIKNAQRSNLTIEYTNDVETIITLFRDNKGKTIRSMNASSYQTLLKLTQVLKQKSLLKCISVKNIKAKTIAGGIFIVFNNIIIFLFSGSNDEAKKCGAMSFLFDSLIKDYAEKNMLLDFEGSNDTNLLRFYKGFGAEEINYSSVRKNTLPKLIRWMKD